MSFTHKAVYGTTGSGKSWLLKRRAAALRKHRQIVIVLNPTGEPGWAKGCKMAYDVDQLETMLNDPANKGAFVLIDEAADLCEDIKPKVHETCFRLFRKGRHRGFTCYIATQFPTGIWPRIRRNCRELYCFALPDEVSARQVWKDYGMKSIDGKPLWEIILNLPPLLCVHVKQPNVVEYIEL